ncbi:hypothetical protein Amsp01_097170 [Amycolatopsis sp. NBRC 101858]|uniref:effector-associated constant component EACC1 n=1 Tax=Amycolatopsis sp. NBRC 101858 TaxID=3032200 RepID=UPI0024A008BD|nr:hypothetical protein [Amycolatopsis sp. NBRC 101858]GLY43694.1 hypothetical protein Amsp01_097170 [Amycolatopsis sp. NBRC 101858]
MTIAITFAGSTGPHDLPGWLALDEDLRGHLRTTSGEPAPETMGWEMVVAAGVAAVPVLARSICAYLVERARLRLSELRLSYTENGRTVDVHLHDETDRAELTRLLLEHRSVTITQDGDAPTRP